MVWQVVLVRLRLFRRAVTHHEKGLELTELEALDRRASKHLIADVSEALQVVGERLLRSLGVLTSEGVLRSALERVVRYLQHSRQRLSLTPIRPIHVDLQERVVQVDLHAAARSLGVLTGSGKSLSKFVPFDYGSPQHVLRTWFSRVQMHGRALGRMGDAVVRVPVAGRSAALANGPSSRLLTGSESSTSLGELCTQPFGEPVGGVKWLYKDIYKGIFLGCGALREHLTHIRSNAVRRRIFAIGVLPIPRANINRDGHAVLLALWSDHRISSSKRRTSLPNTREPCEKAACKCARSAFRYLESSVRVSTPGSLCPLRMRLAMLELTPIASPNSVLVWGIGSTIAASCLLVKRTKKRVCPGEVGQTRVGRGVGSANSYGNGEIPQARSHARCLPRSI